MQDLDGHGHDVTVTKPANDNGVTAAAANDNQPTPRRRKSTGGGNKVRIVCGPRGCGKTTRSRWLVREDLDEGRWVFAHDPAAQYAGLLERYTSIQAWIDRAVTAVNDNKPMPRGAAFAIDDPMVLLDLVEQLGARWNSAVNVRFPMTLVFDEGALLAMGTWIDKRLSKVLAMARHLGIYLVFLVQRKAQISIQFWDLLTDAYLFRQPTGQSKELEQPLSVDIGSLRGLELLEPYQYVHVVQGQGPVAAP